MAWPKLAKVLQPFAIKVVENVLNLNLEISDRSPIQPAK